MRAASLLALTLAACGLSHAATNSEATYVVGNLNGLEPGAEGTLQLDGDRLTFRSGKLTIEAPYAQVTGAELGAKLTHSNDAPPLYKVWQLHKRFGGDKTIYQNFTVTFKDASGNDQTMTLEMTERAAAETQETLEVRTGRRAHQQRDDWWGDDRWRTNRNHETWDKTAALGSR
ncbi:MAG TPA: hypothetical protein VGR73_12450 [Bryobacteraceae bacterium]|nr:hypothetical protein [Bryobacteraceae bacterium]